MRPSSSPLGGARLPKITLLSMLAVYAWQVLIPSFCPFWIAITSTLTHADHVRMTVRRCRGNATSPERRTRRTGGLAMSSLPLEGKRAVVTGASKGIGRSIAFAFAREGATLALVARGHDELEALARDIREAGGHAAAIPADVTNAEQVRRMADATHAALGGVDILVNGAGAAESHDFPRHPDELWHRMLAVNLTSVYRSE